MLKVRGTIPEEIAIISSVERAVYRQWEEDVDDFSLGEEILVTPAFISDSANIRTLASAVGWAETARQYYDPKSKKLIVRTDPVKKDVRKNTPFKDVRIIKLEYRGNGGRAYKVVTQDNYYFDMREDVMVETMLKKGVQPGGILNGEFVWARVNTTMKMVRVGSELHTALVSASEKKGLKNIAADKFVPGGVYEGKNNEQFIFIGHVDSTLYSYTYKKNHWNRYAHVNSTGPTPTIQNSFDVKKKHIKNRMLWFHFPYGTKKYDHETFLKNKSNSFCYNLHEKFNVVRQVDTLKLDHDIITNIRESAYSMVTAVDPVDYGQKMSTLSSKAYLACMYRPDKPLDDNDEYLALEVDDV